VSSVVDAEFLRDGARRATRWRTPLPFP